MEMDIKEAQNTLEWALAKTNDTLTVKIIAVETDREIYKIEFRMGQRQETEEG